jgi:hypothetical protein
LNNSGSVDPDEFAKAIEKIGIMIPTKQVSTKQENSETAREHAFGARFP